MARKHHNDRDSHAGPSQRALRVGELIRHALAEMLTRGDVHDPVLEGHLITVPEVRMSPDLRLATIYVMPLGGKDVKEVIEALERNKRYLRGEIAHRVNLKFAPDIRFRADERFDEAERIGFFQLAERYASRPGTNDRTSAFTDLPATIVTVTRGGERRRVQDLLGAPDGLRAFERHIEAVSQLRSWLRLDVNTLSRDDEATSLSLNEIGRVRLRTQQPIFFDEYRRNRVTGSFILVDEATSDTVAAGMLREPGTRPTATPASSPNVVWHPSPVSRDERRSRLGHTGATVWLTGLSGSGKTAVAGELERMLLDAGRPAFLLDAELLRFGLNADLGFTAAGRSENVRRCGEVARLFAEAGNLAIVSVISASALPSSSR